MRAYFHRAAILGVPANILVLPLAGIMLNIGVAAIALSYISLPFAQLAARIAAVALHWTLGCVDSVAIFTFLSGESLIPVRCFAARGCRNSSGFPQPCESSAR